MSTLLDKFKLKKTPAKIAKIRIRMSGKQIGESSETSERKIGTSSPKVLVGQRVVEKPLLADEMD